MNQIHHNKLCLKQYILTRIHQVNLIHFLDIEYDKKEEHKDIVDLEMGFDFTLIDNITYKKEGYRNTLVGIISSEKANKFLGKENKDISEIEFKSYSNGEVIQTVELTYYQHDFKILRTVDYSYLPVSLELPKNIKKF